MVKCPECGHDVPERKTRCLYCGRAVEDGVPSSTEAEKPQIGVPDWMLKVKGVSGEDVVLTFGLKKSKRRKPLSKVALMIIFMSSFVLGGWLVWIFR
jgi:hypothetical protein